MSYKSGRIIKAVGGKFVIKSSGNIYDCLSRGRLKRYGEIIVGDIVDIEKIDNRFIIVNVHNRKNSLIRPLIANIDYVLIVIAPVPKPDFILVDKLIINCHKENIVPILCYNKTDIYDDELVNRIKSMYENIIKTIFISAITYEGINELKKILKGKFTCFAGQSAVGKSSLLNAIANDNIQSIGELSRIERGKNTTRHIEIFYLDSDIMIADTCGFSSLENIEMPPEELKLYYDEYMEISSQCRFKGCSHIAEPDCAIKNAVKYSQLNAKRYERYRMIYDEIKLKWSRRYE